MVHTLSYLNFQRYPDIKNLRVVSLGRVSGLIRSLAIYELTTPGGGFPSTQIVHELGVFSNPHGTLRTAFERRSLTKKAVARWLSRPSR